MRACVRVCVCVCELSMRRIVFIPFRIIIETINVKKDCLALSAELFSNTILREKSLAIYFGDSQFRRNRIFNFIVLKIYVDKRSRE